MCLISVFEIRIPIISLVVSAVAVYVQHILALCKATNTHFKYFPFLTNLDEYASYKLFKHATLP